MRILFKTRYNGYRQPVIQEFEVKVPKGATELQKKQIIDQFYIENVKQDNIIQHYPYQIIK